MTITEVIDRINTLYEDGKIQGIAVSVLVPDGFENFWHINENFVKKQFLVRVGMA
jgi:hypothetical protein